MTDAECMRKGLLQLLVAATVNKVAARHNACQLTIPVSSFLTDLRLVIAQYKQVFQRPITSDIIDTKAELTRYLSLNSFKRFVTIKDDDIVIDADEDTFVLELKSIVLDGVQKYSQFLILNINDLLVMRSNFKDIADTQPNANTTEEEKDKMEVDEKPESVEAEAQAEVVAQRTREKEDEQAEGEEKDAMNVDESELEKQNEDSQKSGKEVEVAADDELDINENSENIDEEVKFDIPDIQDVEAEQLASIETKEEAEEKAAKEVEAKEEVGQQVVSELEEQAELDTPSKEEEANKEGEDDEAAETATKDGKAEVDDSEEEEREKSRDALRVKDSRKRSRSPSASDPHKRFRAIATNLVREIQAHRYSSLFLQPVNEKEVPDYYDVVYQPRDLKNILKEVRTKSDAPQYTLIKELERDIMLMFANCIMYNHDDEDLVSLTRSMRDDVVKSLKMFKDTEAEV